MKNLKLTHKMMLLAAILMVTVLSLAYVGIDRLNSLNREVQTLVDDTMRKGELATSLEVQLLSAAKAQKNAILAPDDKSSLDFANQSRSEASSVEQSMNALKELIDQSHETRETRAVEDLQRHLVEFYQANEEALKLAVQNTNLKAQALCWGSVQEAVQDILEATDRLNGRTDAGGQSLSDTGDEPEVSSPVSPILRGLGRDALQLQVTLRHHVDAPAGSDEIRQLDSEVKMLSERLRRNVDRLPTLVGQSQMAEVFNLTSVVNRLAEDADTVTRLSTEDTNNRSIGLSLNQARLVVEDARKSLGDLRGLLDAQGKDGRDRSVANHRFGIVAIGLAAVLGLLLNGLLSLVITRSVTQPVTRVRDLTQRLAAGELDGRLALQQRDELGELGLAADSLAETLTGIVTEIREVSGRLAHSSSELSSVSADLVSQSEQVSAETAKVASASEELSSNITMMAAAAEQTSMNVASISSASEEMSINVGTISSAAEQTSSNVSVVSKSIEDISDSFQNVLAVVRQGSQTASQATKMADAATQTMQTLNQAGAEISKVTEAIKMIALQTNLLALNATIEATSAGEAGKGFAVVAHEIKELANQSATAAEDIARKIEDVQQGTREAVQVIQKVSSIIQDLSGYSDKISQSVETQTTSANAIARSIGEANKGVSDIARSIAEVAKAANDMSRNVAEASRGVVDVSRNVAESAKGAGGISASVHSVSQATQATNQSAGRVLASADVLKQITHELRHLISRFKTRQSDA